MIYIEPTPYIVGLIHALYSKTNYEIDVVFLENNFSQQWDLVLDKKWKILAGGNLNKFNSIIQLISKKQYDIVHLAGWGHSIFLLLILLNKLKDIKTVVETDTPLPRSLRLWKRIIKRLYYPFLFKCVDLFFPGGTRQANYLKFYGVKDNRILKVQMTVDVEKIKKYASTLTSMDISRICDHYSIKSGDIIYLFVGRLVNHKGILDLIFAFQQIKNSRAKLLIVGDGLMREQVENAIESNSQIYYVGRLSGTDLIEMYCVADVLILPSHFEPWGLVVNEAMAVGKPVIVSDRIGCIDDLVIHKKTGLIVKAESILELKESIEYMSDFEDHRKEMGKKALEIISSWTLENEAINIWEGWNRLSCV